MNIEQARFHMIEQQIRTWNVLNAHVLELLAQVHREDFIPPTHAAFAFTDVEIPLPDGGKLLPPRVEARLVQELQAQRHEKVLLIGAQTGYMAALLSHCAQKVVAVDASAAHLALAKTHLQKAHVVGVQLVHGDGSDGLPSEGPYDAILLTGSVAEVPQALFSSLKRGGRLLAIVGQAPAMSATLYTQTGEGPMTEKILFEIVAERLPGFAEASAFSF